MSKALSKLDALCDVLSFMRTPTAFDSANQMYKHFCKSERGTTNVRYLTNRRGKIWAVQFEHTTWFDTISKVAIETTKYY
jgi:hypothetical protein